MTPAEVVGFLARSRTATVASIGADGMPHLVARWYGLIGDAIYIETKAKSQKRSTCDATRGWSSWSRPAPLHGVEAVQVRPVRLDEVGAVGFNGPP